MQAQNRTSMLQAPVIRESSVSGHTSGSNAQGGGLIFFYLNESDVFDLTSETHREALWFCFADLLQADLDKVKDYWNSHRIRKSKHATISGVPDMMYFLLEEFGYNECLHAVSAEKITEMENRYEDEESETNPIFEEYFHYVMENNSLQQP